MKADKKSQVVKHTLDAGECHNDEEKEDQLHDDDVNCHVQTELSRYFHIRFILFSVRSAWFDAFKSTCACGST